MYLVPVVLRVLGGRVPGVREEVNAGVSTIHPLVLFTKSTIIYFRGK